MRFDREIMGYEGYICMYIYIYLYGIYVVICIYIYAFCPTDAN